MTVGITAESMRAAGLPRRTQPAPQQYLQAASYRVRPLDRFQGTQLPFDAQESLDVREQRRGGALQQRALGPRDQFPEEGEVGLRPKVVRRHLILRRHPRHCRGIRGRSRRVKDALDTSAKARITKNDLGDLALARATS